MLKSMTGFGTASIALDTVEYTVEIKTVNHRYLKVSQRLPDALSALEPVLEKQLRKQIERGSVNVSVRMKTLGTQAGYRVNESVLSNYLDQLKVLETETNPMFRVNLGSLMQLPGVCEPPALEELAKDTQQDMLTAYGKALQDVIEMRTREGETVVADLLGRADEIETILTDIAGRVDDVVQLYHDKTKARVEQLLEKKLEIDPEALAREVAMFAERSDIAEEVSRLTAHLGEFRTICQSNKPAGRKLDFMSQEMLREANTIASKATDATICRQVVDIKTAIDRIKEQAANLE